MTYAKPCSARWRALTQSVLSSSLLLLCGACTTLAPTLVRPDPPPPDLAGECYAGPDLPMVDTRLDDLLEIIRAREAAAAECRVRHRGLVRAWPKQP